MLATESPTVRSRSVPTAPSHNRAGQIYFSESSDPRARSYAIVRVGSDMAEAADASVFFADLDAALSETGHHWIVLDFRDVPFLPSVVFSELVRFHTRMKRGGGSLRICHCGDVIRDVLRVTHLDRLLDVRADLASALLN